MPLGGPSVTAMGGFRGPTGWNMTALGSSSGNSATWRSEAGRDPASLPISIFRVPDDLTKLRFCQEIGVDRVVFSLPAEKEDKILPILDRWVQVKRELGD